MTYPILQPAIVLILWSIVMVFWMAATRIPAAMKAGLDPRTNVGGRGQDLEGVLPPKVLWKGHNANNILEQPTLFYAVVLMIAVVAPLDTLSNTLAWIYVALRVAHSLYQSLVNVVIVRTMLFTAGTLVLLAMTVRAAVLVF